jgi:hypothetical protein
MKQISFSNLKTLGMNLNIDDKNYNIEFIPYPIEKDIYNNMEKLDKELKNIYNLSDEWLEKIKNWIWNIISHKKNNNEVPKDIEEFFYNLGLAEIIQLTIELINFIARRVKNMAEEFKTELNEQETMEKKTKKLE